MKFTSNYILDLGGQTPQYFKLLNEEDFDFKTKDILVKIKVEKNTLVIEINANSIIDLKIGSSAVMKSLEIIQKTLDY